MEDLAAFAAGLYVSLITLSVGTIVIAVLARLKRLPFYIAMTVNIILGLVAAGTISIAWALGVVPFVGLAISSIILTLPPKKPKA